MDQHDWELLDRQLRGPNPSPRNNGGMFLTVVAFFFFTGMTLGGILFAHESKPMRIASNTVMMMCDDHGACRIRSHPPSVAAL
jgi:hypothetical protein